MRRVLLLSPDSCLLLLDAFHLAAAKFFKPPFSLGKPQRFDIWLDFIIERRQLTHLEAVWHGP